jgi:hypothetical protein
MTGFWEKPVEKSRKKQLADFSWQDERYDRNISKGGKR